MKTQSRVANSYKNAKVSLAFYLLTLVLQFVFRKVFITNIGSDFLGLNTTAVNLLQFLNIAELGVGAAISYVLYKPLAENDRSKISEIISVQGYLYKIIGVIIAVTGILIMFAFPWYFKDISIPLWYTYATFSVLLISSLLGFFYNYQQVVLISDQKEYKLNYAIQGVKIFKLILQILAIYFLSNGYIWWLAIEFVAGFGSVIGIKYVIKKEYPWLESNAQTGKKLIGNYTEITNKTKQLFAHKIAGFALNQSSPLIIFSYSSLSFIAIYGNYLLIISGVSALLGAVFNSTNAGIGNLVSEGDKNKILSVFNELFSIRFFLTSVSVICVYKLTPIFITYWVGKSFVLDKLTLTLMLVIMFINLTRLSVDSFISAYGLFSDTKAPIIETILNIGLAITLGYFYQTNGVLVGVIISLLVIIVGWKPYFLFSSGFKVNYVNYFKLYTKNFLIVTIVGMALNYCFDLLGLNPYKSMLYFIWYSALYVFFIFTSILIGYYFFVKEMKIFIERLKIHLIK